ncbi:MAG: TonB family protein [Pseudomonadota bacterium]
MTTTTRRFLAASVMAIACIPAHASGEAADEAVAASATPAVALDAANCMPIWPLASLRHQEEGTVELMLLVAADGTVKTTRLVKSSGFRDLDKATITGAVRCKYVPAMVDGAAQARWFPLKYQWQGGSGRTPAVADFGSCAKPEWPRESLRNEETGTVTLGFLIGEDGAVEQAMVKKSSGHPLLDLAAQEGIARCRFKPGTDNGKPRQAWMTMQYVWTLEGPGPAQRQAELDAARQGAERGEADAQARLGIMFYYGTGVDKDEARGLALLRQAADQGLAKAQESLGLVLLARTSAHGDPNEALGWYRKAAEQGAAGAQYMTAMLALRQFDTASYMAWLRKAAQQGHAPAQGRLGIELLKKDAGELAEAIDWLQKAAERGERPAQFALGQCYETGRGVARDLARAVALYQKAAAAGNPDALASLANLYESGQGVAQDAAKAKQLRQASMESRMRQR